jgi:uncharacterized protein YigA (DUF484 family)
MDRANVNARRQAQSLENLRVENHALRSQLDDILELAHRNQSILARHQSFELKIIGASHFKELISYIFSELANTSDLDIVTLALVDPRQDLQQMLNDLRIDLQEFPGLLFVRHEHELQTKALLSYKPLLGKYQGHLYGNLYRSCTKNPPVLRSFRWCGKTA